MSKHEVWQFAGSAPETYQRALVPAIFAPWVSQVVELANPRPGDRVLDVACGTGVVARSVASRVGTAGSVTGIDLNAGMLAVAKSVPVSDQPSAPIHWQEGNAGKLPFPSAVFDIVYCQLGLQFFPDRTAALREMHRVLVAGGRLALMVWGGIQESPVFSTLAVLLERHIGREAASFMQAPFSLSDADELAALTRSADFRKVAVQSKTGSVRFPSIERFVADYIAGTPLAAYVSAAGEKAREQLLSETQHAFRQYVENGELVFSIAARLLKAKTQKSATKVGWNG